MAKEKIIALRIEPHKHPEIIELPPNKQALLTALNIGADIEGEIEAQILEPHVYAIYNDLRCMTGFDGNRRLGKDIIAGTFYVIATDKQSHPCSMPEDKIKKYVFRFWDVEVFNDIEMIEAILDTMFGTYRKYE
jgi:hypothetical protein